MNRRQTLSLCMIVRNEEHVIEDCLRSVAGIVDQIVVVDTGSTDTTIDICKKFGAEVYRFRWVDDFSKARNESIKYAKGDWILWMDADERLDPGSINELKKLLKYEKIPVAYKVSIKNFKADGSFYFSDAHRLFNNNRGISFYGPIHEQVSPSIIAMKGELRNSNVLIVHLGYSYKGERAEKKRERNKKLLLKYVEKDPKNAYAHYTLGQFYGLNGEYEKAVRHYRVALKYCNFDKPLTCSLYNCMAEALINIKDYKSAEIFVRKSLETIPEQVYGNYLYYRISHESGNHQECITHLENLLRANEYIKKYGKRISADGVIDDEKITFSLLSCSFNAENYDIFNKYSSVYISSFDDTKGLKYIYNMSVKAKDYTFAVKILEKLYKSEKNIKYLEDMAILYIKLQKFQEAITVYEKLIMYNPENVEYYKKIAGLYAKIGQKDRAIAILSKLNIM
ncbi:MAG: glycosyltransferase [Candidatus Marinimicrobia bacterium]|nr:glycosyltransferase [Candidatus Neomarinimicrobiota bacterium]